MKSSTYRRQPLLSSTTCFALAAVVVSTFAYHVIQRISSSPRKDDDDDHGDYSGSTRTPPEKNATLPSVATCVLNDEELSNSNRKVPLFPWEPMTERSRSQKEAVTRSRTTKPTTTTSYNYFQAEQEIDFLASMTFANGGLRAPNCPCCQ